ncbi:hypothetical protein EYC84_007893 [Monilinia fructicola]|uniref:Uncharacterized protein n=1 Tax=Monilinia fructicola TaxID=38448 RepID=A0A5M9JMC6_MONFR|nr:hypothetical protein EYC84_007893 [Monilinia fructicola]
MDGVCLSVCPSVYLNLIRLVTIYFSLVVVWDGMVWYGVCAACCVPACRTFIFSWVAVCVCVLMLWHR